MLGAPAGAAGLGAAGAASGAEAAGAAAAGALLATAERKGFAATAGFSGSLEEESKPVAITVITISSSRSGSNAIPQVMLASS